MEVGYQRADVTQGVFLPQFDNRLLSRHVQLIEIALVGRVNRAFLWNPKVGVGQNELPVFRIESEPLNAVLDGHDHHCAGAIDDVCGSDLLASGFQEQIVGCSLSILPKPDAEYGADAYRDVDIGRAV